MQRIVYSTSEFAEMCGVTPSAVRGWIEAGDLTAHMIRGAWRIPVSEVDRFRGATPEVAA